MATGLEQVHAVTEQALKNLDQEARRLNRRLNDTRDDIAKAKAEYEQVSSAVLEAKTELAELQKKKTASSNEIDDHRVAQVAVIEAAGKKLDEHSKKVAEAVKASEAKEQKAQEALSKFLETRSAFLQKVKALQGTLDKAVADIVA